MVLRKCIVWRAPAARSPTTVRSHLTPLEALTQVQLGIIPPLGVQRGFLMEHCERQLERRGITEAKLIAMDGRLCTQLLKQLVYEMYLSVPFRVFSFDMEFTGPPVFTASGPTEDITELGLYSPDRNEVFSCLVRPPCGRKQGPGVTELTHISDEMLERDGLPFEEAWSKFLSFVETPHPNELPGADERILLLSHGGKLADVSLIKWTLEKFHLELPSCFVFGDTIHLIRDSHRRRPVTVDKHPPSWGLGDLVQWLRIPPTLPAHRAGNDAKMTWDALYHTLMRYGDDELTPREQLIPRFFDEEAKRSLRERTMKQIGSAELLSMDDTDFLLADASSSSGHSGTNISEASKSGFSTLASDRGQGNKDPSSSTPADNLMDLDFDDLFRNTGATSSANDVAPVVEFQLREEFSFDTDAPGKNVAQKPDNNSKSAREVVSRNTSSATRDQSAAKSKKTTSLKRSPRNGKAKKNAEGMVEGDVFLV